MTLAQRVEPAVLLEGVAYVPAAHVRACTGEGFVELGRLRVWIAEHGVTRPTPGAAG